MKYTAEEELVEIMRRSKKVILHRERRKVRLMAGLTGVIALAAVVALILLPGGTATTKESVYGAFLLADETGGYVLVALISFILGIAVAFLCIKYKRLRDLGEKKESND